MIHAQALSWLVLRRLCAGPRGVAGPTPTNGGGLLSLATTNSEMLAEALLYATRRAWLTLELHLCREAITPHLSGPDTEALLAVLEHSCFTHLNATPAPFREQARRELHAARSIGPLAAEI